MSYKYTLSFTSMVDDTTIEQIVEEDSFRLTTVLGIAPTADVNVEISLPDQLLWLDGTSGSKQLVFSNDNFSQAQTVELSGLDDLLITGDLQLPIQLNFSSSDPVYGGLSETHSINVIDNDFQRSFDPDKGPSDGNNHIIYDVSGMSSELGDGNDWLDVSADMGSAVSSKLFKGNSGDDRLWGVVQAEGGTGDDDLHASGSSVSMYFYTSSRYKEVHTYTILSGGDGNDSLDATDSGASRVYMAGGSGQDNIVGSSQTDIIWGDGYSAVSKQWESTGYSDRYQDHKLPNISSAINNVTYSTSLFSSTVNSNLADTNYNDIVHAGAGDDIVWGGSGQDELRGQGGNDTLYGEAAADTLYGDGGDDSLSGGLGQDVLKGGEGDDSLYGNDGNDRLEGDQGADYLAGGSGDDTLYGDAGNDELRGDDGDDSLFGGLGQDVLRGGEGNDNLQGDDEADTLKGDGGDDVLSGGLGDDQLEGGEGADSLLGGEGSDRLIGGEGADTLTGGAGSDVFVSSASDIEEALSDTPIFDVITDFTAGVGGDVIDLTAIHMANLNSGFGDDWAGLKFPYTQGYIGVEQVDDDTHVKYDRDGMANGYSATTVAVLEGVTASEIILGVNTLPLLTDDLILIESSQFDQGLSEDSGATISYRVVLAKAPVEEVRLSIQSGGQLAVDAGEGFDATSALTFTSENWWVPQTVSIRAQDDWLIEGDEPVNIDHVLSSQDSVYDGVSETHSINVIDNDFQRSFDPDKGPSDGNNHIIYDVSGMSSELGDGNDWLDVSADMGSAVSSKLFKGNSGDDRLWGVVQAEGGTGDDDLHASGSSVSMYFYTSSRYKEVHTYTILSGGDGNDSLDATDSGASRVYMAGGSGQDNIVGSSQTDIIWGDGYSAVSKQWESTGYSDRYQDHKLPNISSAINNVTYSTSLFSSTVNSNLADTNYNDIVHAGAGDDIVWGGSGQDELRGQGGNDTLYGEAAADTLYGDGGDDSLSGGLGQDVLKGGEGDDSLYGNDGNDRLEGDQGADYLAGGSGDDTLYGDAGNDELRGDDGDDSLFGGLGQDVLRGGEGNDNLQGDDEADTLKGDGGDDVLSGGLGDDQLEGGEGADSLLGGEGSDRLIGGEGADTLTGGAGSDVFVSSASDIEEALSDTPIFDVITDFTAGVGGDVIDLTAIHMANLNSGFGDDWAGLKFPYTQGYIGVEQVDDDTHVKYDRDGMANGYSATTVAVLEGVTASEIILGVNTLPLLTDDLILIESSQFDQGLSEDSGATISYRVVLAKAPVEEVRLSIQSGGQLAVDAGEGFDATSALTFTSENWWVPQTVSIRAQDDWLIEGDEPVNIDHVLSSQDSVYDGVSETHSINVIDNDFQRSFDPDKGPSDGNNHIIYDVSGMSSELGDGNDWLDVSADMGSAVSSKLFKGNSGDDRLWGVVQAEGGTGDDDLHASGSSVSMYFYTSSRYKEVHTYTILSGGDGNDSLDATDSGASRVYMAGGSGQDNIVGSSQTDIIWGDGYSAVSKQWESTGYSDRYQDHKLPNISSAINNVTYSTSLFSSTVNSNLADTNYNDIVHAGAGDDIVWGGSGQDELRGQGGNDTLYGEAAADTLYGDGGDDSLSGGLGQDVLKGGEGDDSLYGNDGNDRLEGDQGADYLAGGSGDDTLYGDAGNDELRGDDGDDSLFGGLGQDVLRGGEGNDNLQGDDEADTLKGDGGDDVLSGGLGDDQLEGGEGADSLLGGEGSDRLIGGEGADTLTGGAGSDVFVYTHSSIDYMPDVITDFTPGAGGDVLDILHIHDENINQGLASFGASEFPFTHGYYRFLQQGDNTILGYDRDGHNLDYEFEPITVMQGVNASDLAAENFDFDSENYNYVRTGFNLVQTVFPDGSVTLSFDLVGGQPSAEVTINTTDQSGNLKGSVSFLPEQWQGSKSITLSDVDQFVFSMQSDDPDYATGQLSQYITDETHTFETPRFAESDSIYLVEENSNLTLGLTSSVSATTQQDVRLVSKGNSSIGVNGSLTVNGSNASLTFTDNNLSGVYELVGIVDLDGSPTLIEATVNFVNENIVTVVPHVETVYEGQGSNLIFDIMLDSPAGENIQLAWKVNDSVGVDILDFEADASLSGVVDYGYGEDIATVTIPIIDDDLVEDIEKISLGIEVITGNIGTINNSSGTLIVNDDNPVASGTLVDFKGNMLDASVSILLDSLTLDLGNVEFNNIEYNAFTGEFSFDLWINPSVMGQNFEFNFTAPANTTLELEDSFSSWSVIQNRIGDEFRVAGISSSGDDSVDLKKLMRVEFEDIFELTDMPELLSGKIGEKDLPPSKIYQATTLNADDGNWSFEGPWSSYDNVIIDMINADLEGEIDTSDALMALKIANGSLVEGDLASPLQIVAADIDQSGVVSVLDAWNILRSIVGFDTEFVGNSALISDTVDLSGITSQNSAVTGINSIDISDDGHDDLTIVIFGDVDGSVFEASNSLIEDDGSVFPV